MLLVRGGLVHDLYKRVPLIERLHTIEIKESSYYSINNCLELFSGKRIHLPVK